jgi:hypothetical protein
MPRFTEEQLQPFGPELKAESRNVPPGECALVSTRDMAGLTILKPDAIDGRPALVFLFAVFHRYQHDPDFIAEMFAYFKALSEEVIPRH